MPVEQIEIEKFSLLSEKYPVLDVRTPGEYLKAHIPGALSLPLFDDDERKIIGRKYKQQSREEAVKAGLDVFSERMKTIHNEVLELSAIWRQKNNFIKNGQQYFLLHCWRGGMRSATVAWLLSLYGYKIYTLNGGYKAFRKWVLQQFERKNNFKILGGYTGSGKTLLLKEISKKGKHIIDLESLASHKGSAFGSLGEKQQPSQEMFENLLAIELHKIHDHHQKRMLDNSYEHTKKDLPEVWLEDESRNIGRVSIPNAMWTEMQNSPVYFLEIPFEQRLAHIIKIYGSFDKEDLKLCILKINKRLGGLNTKDALQFLHQNNIKDCFSILLNYYDKYYSASLENREHFLSFLNKIPCESVDISNAETVLDKA